MKEVQEMPTKGQFVAMWEYDGVLWAHTYKWEGKTLFRYDQGPDEFMEDSDHFEHYKIRFFIK